MTEDLVPCNYAAHAEGKVEMNKRGDREGKRRKLCRPSERVEVDEAADCELIDRLGEIWNSRGSINRLVQKLTRSLTRGIAFLFLRSGMLSMLYRAPPILQTQTTSTNKAKLIELAISLLDLDSMSCCNDCI